jgi:transcriptional regulator with XRE-family HTH domain
MDGHAADWSIVGSEFRARRERLKMTQEEVADEAGIKSRDTVSAIEKGDGSLKYQRMLDEALRRLEDAANLPALSVTQTGPAQPTAPTVTSVEPVEGAPQLIRVQVPTLHEGRAIVVEGPVDDPEALAEAVEAIMRRLYPPPTTPEP